MLKNFIRKFLVIAILATSLSLPMFAGDYRIEDQPHVIESVAHIHMKGILKQKENGYLYLDVSDDFIATALSQIDATSTIYPPRHYTSGKGIGAHISVMYETELLSRGITEIQELGQEFTFTVMELRTVRMSQDNRIQKLWLIAVAAPELETLRESYGLSSKLKNHDFHITIGTQALTPTQAKTTKAAIEIFAEAA